MPSFAHDSEIRRYRLSLTVTGLSPKVVSLAQSYLRSVIKPSEISAQLRMQELNANRSQVALIFQKAIEDKMRELLLRLEMPIALEFSGVELLDSQESVSSSWRRSGMGPCIRIERFAGRLFCHGQEVVLPPQLFAWYAWMARRCMQGHHSEVYVRWTDPGIAQEFLNEYRNVVGMMAHYYEKSALLMQGGMTQEFFQEKKSRINRRLKETLLAAAEPYLIKAMGRRPTQKFGLSMPANCIEIV